ncbi:hypothetical protein D9756_000600 [Leucocoprinus leucothites]|uniref:AMMECR1 domain-containing protein n=1 Tax=Leucocoprinus leucothites TaxID=201217 RepID=A0A8H5GEU3_9AGAR|nr:hypothetical protein D9756_000600 [Leucoagaricus leucothites]
MRNTFISFAELLSFKEPNSEDLILTIDFFSLPPSASYRNCTYISRLLCVPSQSRVSLLTNFEDAQSYLDWTIGVHGIQITFPHPSLILSSSSSGAPTPLSSTPNLPRITSHRNFSATYLPEVMPEQGWDKLEAIDSAIQKAGWTGTITEDLRRSIRLRRYQSKQCHVTWDEYWAWRSEKDV